MRRKLAAVIFMLVFAQAFSGPSKVDLPADLVYDYQSGLTWIADSQYPVNIGYSPTVVMSRSAALEIIAAMNRGALENFGFQDWRLAEIRELEMLAGFKGLHAHIRGEMSLLFTFLEDPGAWSFRAGKGADQIYAWPVRGQSAVTVPTRIADTSIIAANSIHLRNQSVVVAGHVVANQVSPGPTLNSDVELSVGDIEATTQSQSARSRISPRSTGSITPIFVADSIKTHKKAVIGDVYFNELQNNGTVGGQFTPIDLPIFPNLPVFRAQSPAAEAEDFSVGAGESALIFAGDHRDIFVADGGTLTFQGSIFNVRSITAGIGASLLFNTASEVRVEERFISEQDSIIGPAPPPDPPDPEIPPRPEAGEIIFYVAGIDGTTGTLGDEPRAVQLGRDNDVDANFYAPNGTIRIRRDALTRGAFVGLDVLVENSVSVDHGNFWAVQKAPVAGDDAFSVDEGATFDSAAAGLNLLDNDVDERNPDDSLTVADAFPTSGTSLDPVTPPANGSLTLNPDGSFVYVHNGGEAPSDSFVYQVCDDGTPVLCDQATVLITVNPINDAPVADGQDLFTNGAQALVITLTGSDAENDDLTFSIFSSPSNGVLGAVQQDPPPFPGNPPGCNPAAVPGCIPPDPPRTSATVTYTPNTSDDLEDSFFFQVADTSGATATAEVRLNPSGDPTAGPGDPNVSANDFFAELVAGNTVDITLTGNAPEGVVVSFSVLTLSANGTLRDSGGTVIGSVPAALVDDVVNYAPDAGHEGLDSFDFEACGDIGGTIKCGSATVTIETVIVRLAQDQTVSTGSGGTVEITLDGNPGGEAEPASAITFRGSISGRAVGITEAAIAGNVADANGDGLGDATDNLPGPAPILVAAGVDVNLFTGSFDDEADFLNQLSDSDTFDFETSSGFPASGTVIGLFNGIDFDAQTFATSQATSGGQTMTGTAGTFSTAILDFTGLAQQPNSFGFFALDLTLGEIIRVTVNYSDSSQDVFDVQLAGGDPAFTPTYFGFTDTSRTIDQLTFVGTDTGGANRAWLIDDLTVGSKGLAGTARIHIEFDVSGLTGIADDLTGAGVTLFTRKGTVDSLDTFFFTGGGTSAGSLDPSDFQSPLEELAGVVMTVPAGPTGTEGSFNFSVLDSLKAALNGGADSFIVQGRVDESLAGGGFQRGLQVFSSADGNFTTFKVPTLDFATPPPVFDPLVYTITSLPINGTLKDSTGAIISAVPTQIPNANVTYTADTGFVGTDSFQYEVNEFGSLDTALVTVLVGDCATNEAACDDGRNN